MLIPATQLRVGMLINYQNDLYRIMAVTHITPGNWRGMVQTRLVNIETGSNAEHRFRSEDRVDQAAMEHHLLQFSYRADAEYHFMNTENYEQIHLNEEVLGDSVLYLIPNIKIKSVLFRLVNNTE
jgi:elongation factor P